MYPKPIFLGLFVISFISLGALNFQATPSAASVTFTVNSTSDAVDVSPGNGVCATAGGQCTLRAAIMETNALGGDDSIILPSGTYLLTIVGKGEDGATLGDLDINGNLILTGAGIASTIVDGNALDRVFHITSTSVVVTITDVTIQNGNAPLSGGGIYNSGTLTLNDSIVKNNTAPDSGGIYNGGSLTLNNSAINNNTGGGIHNSTTLMLNSSTVNGNNAPYSASSGGGIDNSGVVTMNDSIITGNIAEYPGGGIRNNGTLTATNSTVSGNMAIDAAGGGIFNLGTLMLNNVTINSNIAISGGGLANSGTLIVTNSTVSGNTGDTGGGIDNEGTLTLNNSTISGNMATFPGGGIYNGSGTLYLNNATITNNIADSNGDGSGDGGGIFNDIGTVNPKNTIIAGNDDNSPATKHPDCSGTLISQGYNLIQNTTGCAIGGDTTGNITGLNADLGPLGDNGGPTLTHALLSSSPAIDTGNPTGCNDSTGTLLTTDQRGYPRPLDGNGDGTGCCDMGAFEIGLNTEVVPGQESTLVYIDTQGNPTTILLTTGTVTTATTMVYTPMGMATPPNGYTLANHAFELDAYQSGVLIPGFTFQQPVTITLEYSEADLIAVDETGLTLMYWDDNTWLDASSTCIPPSTYNRDLANNSLSLPICHLSLYALFGPTVEFKLYFPLVGR